MGFVIFLLAALVVFFGGIAVVKLGVAVLGGCIRWCVPLAALAFVFLVALAS